MKFSAWLMLFFVHMGLLACAAPMGGATSAGQDPIVATEANEKVEYRLGTGDRVRLIVFGEADLSGEFAVDSTGNVSLPLVGDLMVRDMTVQEFQTTVDAAFRDGYLNDPKISAEVISHRPFYILGEVKRPGTYAYQNGLTVLNAVATAEGFTYRANERFVFIRREGEDNEQKYPLSSSTPVRPGDTIRIAERFF